jgi:hypothetical protein
MLRAERRRRSDLLVAVAIVAVVGLGIALLAVFGPAAGTTSTPVSGPPAVAPPDPADVPATLTEAWRAPSAASVSPVTDGPLVVTGDADATGGLVSGRDPLTGATRWTYHRDKPLCAVVGYFHLTMAVYRQGEYCSEVTQLVPATGVRKTARNSDIRPDIRFFDLGSRLGAAGGDYLESWRVDLVKTIMYGATRTDAQPFRQPHRGCAHLTTTGTQDRIAVVERCPDEKTLRLSVVNPEGEPSDKPELEFSVPLPPGDARVALIGSDRVAVLLTNPTRLSIRDTKGAEVASHPLDLPAGDLHSDPPGSVAPVSDGVHTQQWWTGSRTIALDDADLRPVWSIPDSLGPGTLWAGRLVVPVRSGLAVVDPDSGRVLRTIPVDRAGWTGPVMVSPLGPVLFEQRGPVLVALR